VLPQSDVVPVSLSEASLLRLVATLPQGLLPDLRWRSNLAPLPHSGGRTVQMDVNNRPGGPSLIVTAKTAHKVHFLDAATLTMAATIDMPGSTHELALSPDGRTAYGSIYGDGIFARRVNPDRRIAVIDLPSRSLRRVIDLGAVYAPHGVMIDPAGLLWSSGELGDAVLVVDPTTDAVQRIDVGATAHWLVISPATGKVIVSVKQDYLVVIDVERRLVVGRITLPHVVEGLAIAPDGSTVYACAQTAAELYVVDTRSHALRQTVPIAGANGAVRQMRRARVSPDNRYLVVSSNVDAHAAVFEVESLRQIASFPTRKGPMGFGFAADGGHAYLCCHDDAVVLEFELASGMVNRTFATEAGCEFIVAYP
jgi:DNA-binding beta-propeller fold protein YncE